MAILGIPLEEFAALTLPVAVLAVGLFYLICFGRRYPRASGAAAAAAALLMAPPAVALVWRLGFCRLPWVAEVTGQSIEDVIAVNNVVVTVWHIAGIVLLTWAVPADRLPAKDDNES